MVFLMRITLFYFSSIRPLIKIFINNLRTSKHAGDTSYSLVAGIQRREAFHQLINGFDLLQEWLQLS
ncbi:hypothetical protein Bresa_01917|uniref:Uncharacterized protein n=1 Tax=Brenneria salicis ATCC 15712 = DSM 30166 TaxID=714314 RepID=A0A366I8A7_9GAMM|nr:hypothetical protein [Brenneria salicis ATCC 15712 = DSM 30166]RBP65765.1 hypothetical protein DES54_10429 [Brenneria salicis ATCC 15712 = DSM 30166]